MTSSRVFVICAIVAIAALANAEDPSLQDYKDKKAAEAEDKAAVEAKDAKMAAVNKVVSMLEDLQLQVLGEGEAEAATYNKFACWCKTTQSDKTDAIREGKSSKSSLSSSIEKLASKRDNLDDKIAGLEKDIKAAEKAMKEATTASDKKLATYKANEADLKSALESLNNAISVLKSSKGASFVQIKSISQTLKQAILLADAMGIGEGTTQKVAALLQTSDDDDTVPVEMEDYKFHSGKIIDMLEKLLGDFRAEKKDVDAEEVKRVAAYDSFIQEKTDLVTAKTLEMEEAKKEKQKTIASLEADSEELTTVSAVLLDDMEYLDETNTICSQKAKTWDQRSKARADEISALTAAMGIVKSTVAAKTQSATIRFAQTKSVLHLADAVAADDNAMEAIEAEAEAAEDSEAPVGFLQKRQIQKHTPAAQDGGRQMVMQLLRNKGADLKSSVLTELATRIAGDPLAKVKKLIQELIERLLQEAANEANQKGWCDKAMADATQKRTYAAEEIEALNAEMAKLAATSDKLNAEIKTLTDEIKGLEDAQKEAQDERDEEKAENANTVKEAEAGLGAIKMAIDILDKFYKTNAKNTVDLSLAQGPADDMPDTGFDAGEAYKGAGAESGGIIGMMEVIQSDFERTISETEKAEEQAEEDHLKFMTETGKSLAEKNMAKKESIKLRDDADQNYSDAKDSILDETEILKTSIEELIELKATCIDTGMSYADRVAMREQEIASLKKALCILGAYAEYGPDGLADAC